MAKKPITQKEKPAVEVKVLSPSIEKSIPDQIYEQLIQLIKKSDKFDARAISNLEVLITTGEIKKSAEVTKAIKKQ